MISRYTNKALCSTNGRHGNMTRCATEDILDLLTDKRLYALRAVADKDILLFEDLDNYELPEGYTKEETWRILTAIRKQASIFLPDDPWRDSDFWFVTTSAISLDSKMIEVRCKAGFPLDEALDSLKGSPFLTRYIERTLIRALETEGIRPSEDRVHAIFTGSCIAKTDLDKVVNNYFKISREAEALSRREITPGLVETLYYRLTEGVHVENLSRRPRVCPLDESITPRNSWECIETVCRRAQFDDMEELRFGPILRLINISWFFWNFDIFPVLNSLVGVLLRNVIAVKWGYPVLSWLPVGYYPFGELNTPRMGSVFGDWSIDFGFGHDFTAYFSTYTRLYLAEIEQLEASVKQLRKLNDLIENTFDFPMNDRQKSILSSLCREPDASLRIAPHQRTFGVAYATARNDFLDLEDKGYLVREQEGKAFVFKACDTLRDEIVSLSEAAVEEHQ